jgi:hypothetical protein
MHGFRRGPVVGAGGGGGIDGGLLSAGSDQFSYTSFPSQPSPTLADPSEPYQHYHQQQEQPLFFQQFGSHYLSGSFEERPNNSFSRPQFASSAGFPPDPRSRQQSEFRHSLPLAPAAPDSRLLSLPPHQQQQLRTTNPLRHLTSRIIPHMATLPTLLLILHSPSIHHLIKTRTSNRCSSNLPPPPSTLTPPLTTHTKNIKYSHQDHHHLVDQPFSRGKRDESPSSRQLIREA